MKHFRLVWKNLLRKKTRLVLTMGSFGVALFLYGLLITIHNAFYQGVEVAGADRLITRNKTSLVMFLPYSQKEKIRSIEGVAEIGGYAWFGGVYQDEKNFFPQFAIEAEHRRMFPEFRLPPEQWEAFDKDLQACVAGRKLAEKFGWKIGQRIPIRGTIFEGVWEFNLVGIYDGSRQEDDVNQFWLRFKYLEERSPMFKGQAGWYTIKLTNPDSALQVCQAIDGLFANSPHETKTEPEALFAAGFAKQFGNIKLILMLVGSVVFVTLLLVTGSTMAMAVRERTGELAILKTLGYGDRLVLALVLAESLTYACVGGGLGLMLAKLFTMGGDPTGGLLPFFYLSPANLLTGAGIAVAVGLAAGILPALQAMNLRIVAAIRRV